ncbi:MAG: SprT-like domain-containing protein [Dehalococcoidia bacterium]
MRLPFFKQPKDEPTRQLRLDMHDRPVPVNADHLEPLARQLISLHAPGFDLPPLRISGRMTRTLGSFAPSRKTITLSARLLAFGTHDQQRQVLLHELAHVIVHHRTPNARAHGREFRDACQLVGADPTRFVDVPVSSWAGRARHAFRCPSCGATALRKRRAKLVRCDCGQRVEPRRWALVALDPNGGQRVIAARGARRRK